MVGTVTQVVGHGPVPSHGGKPPQGWLSEKPLKQMDYMELV